jgi:thymidylate kinase
MNGLLIQFDGIAGSGKTTLLSHVQSAVLSDAKIFDLAEYVKAFHAIPHFEEVADYDYYFTHEPTKAWIGSAIREELSFHGDEYSALEQAQAFSLDRHLLFHRLITPALQAGKTIIQDRGLTSSLLYQTELDPSLTFEDILSIPGNAYVYNAFMPRHLVLTHIERAELEKRLLARTHESKGIYERIDSLMRIQERFSSAEFLGLLEAKDVHVHTIDTSGSYRVNELAVEELFEELLSITV